MAEPLTLDWSTAAVAGDTLTVRLDAEPPKKWREAFEGTAVLLDTRNWKIALAATGAVKVAGIGAGDEDDVRALLEGSVLQANATLVGEAELYGTEPEDDDAEADEERGSDEDLTSRFRSFAGDEADSDAAES